MIRKVSRAEVREKKHRRIRHHLSEPQLLRDWQYSVPISICMLRSLMTA